MDSSDTQLEGLLVEVILNTKEEKSISTFSKKLNMAHLNCPNEDLLGILESLKHFCNIICCTEILVQMDHASICHKDAKHTNK